MTSVDDILSASVTILSFSSCGGAADWGIRFLAAAERFFEQ
jgi:hypothetical protein